MDDRLNPGERRGLVFALRANGVSFGKIATLLGVCRERVRQIDMSASRRVCKQADRLFTPPRTDWRGYAPPQQQPDLGYLGYPVMPWDQSRGGRG
jgi:hypothetical protein